MDNLLQLFKWTESSPRNPWWLNDLYPFRTFVIAGIIFLVILAATSLLQGLDCMTRKESSSGVAGPHVAAHRSLRRSRIDQRITEKSFGPDGQKPSGDEESEATQRSS